MVVSLIILIHIVLFAIGMKSFIGDKKKRERYLFLFLILFSTYMGIAEPASLPIVPLINGVDFIFEPIGRWIEGVLEM
ncbi:hypothetical protein [Metabacillus niabensis]|uniref:hypothetical protein n=1 Tax=Metabacillus niabensis TaxID=324854 RepID=UPI001CFAF45C|nr:hypothetical protein [Metabacillus niabensis]